jgi:tetratricopeptide (TPR) repeat protein
VSFIDYDKDACDNTKYGANSHKIMRSSSEGEHGLVEPSFPRSNKLLLEYPREHNNESIDASLEDAVNFEERGWQQRQAGHLEAALSSWNMALGLCPHTKCADVDSNWTRLCNKILSHLISLHLHLREQKESETTSTQHLDEAAALLTQLHLEECNYSSDLELDASPLLLDLLIQYGYWPLALHVALQLPSTDPLLLARLHLEVALPSDHHQQQPPLDKEEEEEDITDHSTSSQRASMSQQEQLQHLSKCQQLLLSHTSSKQQDSNSTASNITCLLMDLWQDLADAYVVLGEDELAFSCNQSRLQLMTNRKEVALAHYDQAMHVYSPVGQFGLALKEAELALDTLLKGTSYTITTAEDNSREEKADDDHHLEDLDDEEALLLLKLYQFKADVLCRLGRLGESIEMYETLLQNYIESSHEPADVANLLYILGKLCVRAKLYGKALGYFEQELSMTKSVVGKDNENNHLAISKILHEMARVADLGLMDYPRAVRYYQEALRIESRVYQQCCQQTNAKTNTTSTALQDAKYQMGETKRCLGQLHFKMGDFDTALKTAMAVHK